MITRKQIVAEIRNKLKVYDQQGLLDYISINNWIKENIKEFGGNIMNEYQRPLVVEKGKVKLPDNFWALKGAVRCEMAGYSKADDVRPKRQAQRRISYLEWTDIRDYYNYLEGKPCLEDGDSRYITETLFFENPSSDKNSGGYYDFYYNAPQQLKLIPHVNKANYDRNCPNLYCDSDYEISIDDSNNFISTNFNDGFIWVWYKGLPCDDSGDLAIPETSRDKLKNYIIYFAIVKTLEDLWLTEDDPNIQSKLQYFTQMKNDYYADAKAESISKGILGWSDKLINNNRRNTNKYEDFFRSMTPSVYNHPYNPRRTSIRTRRSN